jgi:hypothetical protein
MENKTHLTYRDIKEHLVLCKLTGEPPEQRICDIYRILNENFGYITVKHDVRWKEGNFLFRIFTVSENHHHLQIAYDFFSETEFEISEKDMKSIFTSYLKEYGFNIKNITIKFLIR